MIITNLRINGIKNPMGYTFDQLSCSWLVQESISVKPINNIIEVSEDKGFTNIIYTKEGSDLKQSGEKLELTLKPRTTYYYRITVMGDQGDQATSDVQTFETGKMTESWTAEWISTGEADDFHPVMMKQFTVQKAVSRARLYVTGLGVFEVYLNGVKVGDEYLAPYMTNYEHTIQVITFPLEAQLQSENTIEIMLAKGWYMAMFGLELQSENYGTKMATIGELRIDYTDGTKELIVTDDSWQYVGSDIEDSGIYEGEIYNKLLWEDKENGPRPVEVLIHPENKEGTRNLNKAHLVDRRSLPLVAKEDVFVKEIITTPAGETVLDMGQNFAGWIEFQSNLPKGTKVVFDFGEILQEGNFYNKNYRDAKSQFVYVSNGVAEAVRPHFTYFGFRYVRITGWEGELNKSQFAGKAIYSDLHRTGYIETGHEKINRLYENTLWGLKSNFVDLPTDCPQRSERLGWTGDAQVFAPTASYHMDTRAFFHKFIKDLRDEQVLIDGAVPNFLPNLMHKADASSVWGDIATFLPNTLFQYYGDLEEVQYSYDLMKDWVDYIYKKDEARGLAYLFDFGFTFGDWLALDGATPTSFKGSTEDGYISSVYYYRSVQIVAEMSDRLGKVSEATVYHELAKCIKEAVLLEYFTPTGRLAMDTQAGYIIALKFGIYHDKERLIQQFIQRLQKDCFQIKCGFVGAPLLCTVLAEVGLHELAFDFLLKEGFPSWLYSVNLGATTIWERWNSVSPEGVISNTGMNSLNHYAYGSVMEFMYGHVAGIRPLEAGFKKAIIAPHPDIRLKHVNCAYESVHGIYVSNWQIETDGQLHIHLEVPFGGEALITLPESGKEPMTLMAGKYDFKYMPLKNYRKPFSSQSTLSKLTTDGQAMGILGKYTPALAGIAASGDIEMGAKSLTQLMHMGFLPFDPTKLKIAIEEIAEITV